MKTTTSVWFVLILCLYLIVLPSQSLAGKITIDSIKVSVHTMGKDEFQIHVAFTLPDFHDTGIENITLDQALLSFDVEVLKTVTSDIGLVEVLAAAADGRTPLAGFAYNVRPLTAMIRGARIGRETVVADITELVDDWFHGGLPNHGILLVSHRLQTEKTLSADRVMVPENFQPSLTLFYSIVGDE